jgi:ATP-dependent DNA ligase
MPARRKTPAVAPPIEPMLAKVAADLPDEGDFLFEPKWDGFRALVFRSSDVYIQSRDLRPFNRYFPDLHDAFMAQLPDGCVIDGEIVIATSSGLDFDALQLRLHPRQAASRSSRARHRRRS